MCGSGRRRSDLGVLYLFTGIALTGWWIAAVSSGDYNPDTYKTEYSMDPYVPMIFLLVDRIIEYIHTVDVIKEINKKGVCQFILYSDPQNHDIGLRFGIDFSSKNLTLGYNYQKNRAEAKLELRF